jgi:putative FmdB family regulatory protein
LPLYEYKCAKCGNRFEKIESVSAPEKQKCPKCGGRADRQIAAPAIQFKGSGWYVTDYAKSSAPKSSDASGDGASKAADKTSESKTDSKSESKTESKPAASDNSNKGAAKRKK